MPNSCGRKSYIYMLHADVTTVTVTDCCQFFQKLWHLNAFSQAADKCYCAVSVPSQMVLRSTLAKRNLSIATKIVLQIECKMGGELWAVKIPVGICFLCILLNVIIIIIFSLGVV